MVNMTTKNINVAPWIESGNHFLKEKKWLEATHCLLQGLRVEPDNATAHSLIALTYKKQNRTEQANTWSRQCLILQKSSKLIMTCLQLVA